MQDEADLLKFAMLFIENKNVWNWVSIKKGAALIVIVFVQILSCDTVPLMNFQGNIF